jgi:hypothetical protein
VVIPVAKNCVARSLIPINLIREPTRNGSSYQKISTIAEQSSLSGLTAGSVQNRSHI